MGSTILASLITPGDAITLTLFLVTPIFLLYEFSILLSVLVWRKRDARDGRTETAPVPAEAVAAEDSRAPEDTVAAPTPYDHGDPARQGETPEHATPDPDTPDPDTPGSPDTEGEE